MKALKEKRVSLRSVVRRSLVILSILALIFVGCSSDSDDGGGNNNNNGNGNGNGGGTDVPDVPEAITAVDIRILQQPQVPSFQGGKPDLTGVILEVKWSDGNVTVTSDMTDFYGDPSYCELPSDPNLTLAEVITGVRTPAIDTYVVRHISGRATSGKLILPCVIPMFRLFNTFATPSTGPVNLEGYRAATTPAMSSGLHFTTQGTRVVWYSDQRPDYSKDFNLEGYYEYWSETPWTGARGADPYIYRGGDTTNPFSLDLQPMPDAYLASKGWPSGTTYGEYWLKLKDGLVASAAVDVDINNFDGVFAAQLPYTESYVTKHGYANDPKADFDEGTTSTTPMMINGGCDMTGWKPIAITAAYPPFDLVKAKVDKRVEVSVGIPNYYVRPNYDWTIAYDGTTAALTFPEYTGGTFAPTIQTTPTDYLFQASVPIDEFVEVWEITYKAGTGDFPNVYDDSLEYVKDDYVLNLDANGAPIPGAPRAKVKAMLEAAKPSFTVTYFENKAPPREINWDEFKANHAYYNDLQGNQIAGVPVSSDWYFQTDGYENMRGGAGSATNPYFYWDQLKYDEDTLEWRIILEYVPVDYSGSAKITTVAIPITVWEFNGLDGAERKLGSGEQIWAEEQSDESWAVKDNINTATPGTYTAAEMASVTPTDMAGNPKLLKSINDKWNLMGSYSKPGLGTVRREIPFSEDMFEAVAYTSAYGGGTAGTWGNVLPLRPPSPTALRPTLPGPMAAKSPHAPVSYTHTGTTANDENIPGNGYTYAGLPLYVTYRGEKTDDDTSVTVDLFWQEP